jgi:hypothetical protein
MQTAELVEFASILALQRSGFVADRHQPGTALDGMEAYWVASKCRFDRWGTALGRLKRGEFPLFDGPGSPRGLVEEILGSEVLTRVWTALVVAHDRRHDAQDNEIVARSVHIGHLEMRQRVLRLLIGGPGITSSEVADLNRLRRRAELWTDMLLAGLVDVAEVHHFAHEPERVRRYAGDWSTSNSATIVPTTIHAAVRHAFLATSPSGDLNAQVAAGILAAFPPVMFDSLGLLRSAWVIRLAKTAGDTQRLLDDLFRDPDSYDALPIVSRRFR